MIDPISWLTCPNCHAHLDLATDFSGDYQCASCKTVVMVVDNECLFTEPGHPGELHRCILERLVESEGSKGR